MELNTQKDDITDLLEQSLPLLKRIEHESEEEKLSIRNFLKFLDAHNIFGRSLKQDLHGLYRQVNVAWIDAKDIRENDKKGKSSSKDYNNLLNKLSAIQRKSEDITKKFQEGKFRLVEAKKGLGKFLGDERSLRFMVARALKAKTGKTDIKTIAHLTSDVQTHIQESLILFEQAALLFEQAMSEFNKEFKNLVDKEIDKVRACLTDEGVQEVDFTSILEHMRELQEDIKKRIDMVVKKEKNNLKSAKITVKSSHGLEHVVEDFLRQVPALHVQK